MTDSRPTSPWPAWPADGADAMEQALLARWREERLFAQVQDATADAPGYVFFEGPPTANGRPGIHHVFARTIKDLVCRYHVMNGKRVTRIAGWDTHGLPVELEVEKALGFTGKKDIEAYGVATFAEKCLESVFTYRNEWVNLSERTGYWLDYDRAYVTCTAPYVESVWAILKRLHEKDLLYRGHRVSPYCPRCGTVLSSHELAQGYADVRDKSIYVTFPLADGSGRELVVWTTTPWTLPSNVAVAVHPDLEYAEFTSPAHPGRIFVMAAALTERAVQLLGEGTTAGTVMSGSALVGLVYQRPLDVVALPAEGQAQVVVPGEFVTAVDGSGLVHMAPAFGADDYAAGQAHGLAMLRPVAADGTFVGTTWDALEGKLVTADETQELIIRELKARGRHLRTEAYDHSYPHCWRCKSKLIYYARESWFVRTSRLKDRMRELNAAIDWHPPETGSGRFGEWLANNIDWALSRERYWGTPLPVWVNDRNPEEFVVVGSIAELTALSGYVPEGDLGVHKPWVDEVTWTAADGGTMRRVPEVIDTWFDSGAMPYAQWHWPFEHAERFARHFPADFICEGVDQTRGWFYSLLAIGTALMDQAPFRHVIVNDLVLDAEGQKMSKSRGNVVDPWGLVSRHGADAARLYLLLSSQVWMPKRFDERQLIESAGGFLATLRATYHFFSLYAGEVGGADLVAERPTADRWILGRLDATVAAVRSAYEAYDVTAGTRALVDFLVDDVSNWYVRQNRGRFWAANGEAEANAVATLHEVLVTVARLLAPSAPFTSDWLHRALVGSSVHLAPFPTDAGRLDVALDAAMYAARRLASLGRAARETASLRVRQPVAAMKVAVPAAVQGAHFAALLDLVAAETNVKAIELVTSDADLVRLVGKPNFRTLGKKWGARVKAAAAYVQGLDAVALRALEAGEQVEGAFGLDPEDVVVTREVSTDWAVASDGPYVVALDPVVTPALAREGLARELVNRIQRLRKEAGYDVSTRIVLAIAGDNPVLEAVRAHADYISGETLATDLSIGAPMETPDRIEPVVIDDHAAALAVRRSGDGRTPSGPTPAGTP
jgi:isoleucyl-tRNA synthetase